MFLSNLAHGQLSGTYTIDPNGSGSSNYSNFTSAVSALSTSGVNGAVTFNVKQGTYTEQLSIGSITGASAVNTITFQADPTNTSAATLTYAPTSSASNYTVLLNGCGYIHFDGLTLTSSGTSYGRIVVHTGNVTSIEFNNNTFNGVAGTSTSSNHAATYYAYPANAQGVWRFTNNTFNNITYGIYVYGSSFTTSLDSIFIENNTINTNYYGIYPRYAKYQKVHNNVISANGNYAYNTLYYPYYGVEITNNDVNAGTGYGFYISATSVPSSSGSLSLTVENNDIEAGSYGIYATCSGTASYTQFTSASIRKNNIRLNGGTSYGVYVGYGNFSSSAPGVIENNFISSASPGTNYLIYPYHCSNLHIQHNNVNLYGGSSTGGRGVYLNASSSTSYFTPGGNVLKNNIIVNTGGGYALEAS